MTRAALARMGANGMTAITPNTHPDLHSMLSEVSERADMPTPKAYVWSCAKPMANAVAISSKVPTVAFSETIIDLLSNEELTAVAAHEMGHVKNMGHSGKLSITAGIGGGAAAWIATRPLKNAAHRAQANSLMKGSKNSALAQTMLFAKDFAVITGAMAGSALASRSEEYAADRYGAMMMEGDGVPLMSGLQKLEEYNGQNTKLSTLGKIMKPVNHLTRSHPEVTERQHALGVSNEDVAGYRAVQDAEAYVGEASAPDGESKPEPAKAKAEIKQAEAPENGWQQRMEDAATREAASHSR